MTTEQKQEIRTFLLNKNLPIDIIMEVEDHFVSQINEIQSEKDLSFDEAFNITIISWYDDLRLFRDGSWSTEKTSLLIKKSSRQKLFSILKKSAVIAAISYFLVVLCYFLIPFSVFRISLGVFVGFVMVFPLIIYIKEKKYFDLPKKYKNIRLSAHQNLVSVFFILPMSSGWFFRFVLEINDNFLDPNHMKGIVVNALFLFFFFFEAAIIVSQQKYLEMIKKIIPYLEENFRTSN